MYILAKFFENKDITIEEPSYLGAMNIFRLNNLKMDGVKLEDDGVNIEEFEKSFKNTKLTYLIPDFQNPSATTYSEEKREYYEIENLREREIEETKEFFAGIGLSPELQELSLIHISEPTRPY